MRLFSFLVLLLVSVNSALAVALELKWDAPTTNIDGSPLSEPVTYKIYRKTTLEDFKTIAVTSNTRWTWLVPSLGRTSYYVTAFNKDGESEPSNTLKVIVERIPREDK